MKTTNDLISEVSINMESLENILTKLQFIIISLKIIINFL